MEGSERYVFIDGMRGLAAMSVVLFHLGRDFLGIPVLHYGAYGVVVFFVISGFVICHSFSNKVVSAPYVGRFMLRRSIRLDPTYWGCIALAILVMWLPAKVLGYPAELPSFTSVGLHMFYLQDLTNIKPINIVFWTLCYEIQFYLILCLLFYLVAKINERVNTIQSINLKVMLLTPCLFLSLLWPMELTFWLFQGETKHGLFIDQWYLFLLGVYAYWAIEHHAARLIFATAIVCLVAALFYAQIDEDAAVIPWVGVMTAALFFVAGCIGKLGIWLRQRCLQYLGLISYSLYVSHDIVGLYIRDTGLHLAVKYLGWQSPIFKLVWVVLSIACCLVFAALLHRFVERPSVALSKRVRLKT